MALTYLLTNYYIIMYLLLCYSVIPGRRGIGESKSMHLHMINSFKLISISLLRLFFSARGNNLKI